MNIRIYFILLPMSIIMLAAGCTSAVNKMFYRTVERGDVDIIHGRAGLIRTVYCDIYIEHVDNEIWKQLKEVPFFKGKGTENPAPVCFHFIIENTWKKPFQVERVEIIHEGQAFQAEDFSFIKDKTYTERRYSVNLSSMLKKRRILTDAALLREIDFTDDTIDYRLDFIAPGDRISFFRFFTWFPVEKSAKLRVAIKYFDLKKVIDFDIGRFEYNESMLE